MAMQTVVETPAFLASSSGVMTDAERADLVAYLASNPLAGDLITGTGGVRKLRFAAKGKGTRGGARVIFYTYDDAHPVFALLVYGKDDADNLSAAGKHQMRLLVAELKALWRAK